MHKRTLNIFGTMALLVFLVMGSPAITQGQAWVPEKGQLSMSLSYEFTDVGDHLFSKIIPGFSDEKEVDLGDIKSHTTHLELDYGITNKWALTASLPVVMSRYKGTFVENLKLDDGTFQGGVQDFNLGIRYMSLISPLVVTPSLSVVIPSHNYETHGHASRGKGLKELHLGLYLGKLLDFVSDNLYAHAVYQFVYTEKDSLRANRTNLALTLGYFVSSAMSITINMAYLKTHEGVDWSTTSPDAPNWHFHDRFSKASHLRIAGSVSFEVSDELGFYIGYGQLLWGENDHEIQSISFGTTWSLWMDD